MKLYINIALLLGFVFSTHAQLQTPALSPSATVKQTIGLTEIEVNYSRPSVKERAIFGENTLVPFGKSWRLGANAATKFVFSDVVEIGDTTFKKGIYTVIARPNAASWELKWFEYKSEDWTTYQEKDPISVINTPTHTSAFVESLEIGFNNITHETAILNIAWENTALQIPIKVHTKDQVLRNIENTMAGPSLDDYFQAAVFLHETNTDLPTALTYIRKVTSSKLALFFVVTREARILKDLKMNKEALLAAKRALKLSAIAENDDFIKINQDLISTLE